MENIKSLDNYLNEKRVVIKRKYTDKYPSKKVNSSARIRNAVIDAMADGKLTEEELKNILSEIEANRRWLKRNSKLFDISEDENGVKCYCLSKWGKRIFNRTRQVNEGLDVPIKEQGKKKVNIFVGRFQPFTLGHVKVFKQLYKENGYPVVVFIVRGKNSDKDKNPFSEELQQAMFAKMTKQYPFLEASYVIPSANIGTIFSTLRPTYEPVLWGFGTDRKKPYGYMINKESYRKDLGVLPEFSGYEIKRSDENISASKVRKTIELDNNSEFKKLTPKSIHDLYDALQNEYKPIKENIKMENIKSLNEFTNNMINENITFKELVDKYKDNPYEIGANSIEYVERNNELILRFKDNYDRRKSEDKLKKMGIKAKQMSKYTRDKAFMYRYELIINEDLDITYLQNEY